MSQEPNSHNNTVTPEESSSFVEKIVGFLSKLDSTWMRFAVIAAIFGVGYKVGQSHEEIIKLGEMNRFENEYKNTMLDYKEKYINEILELKKKNNDLESINRKLLNDNNFLKTKNDEN